MALSKPAPVNREPTFGDPYRYLRIDPSDPRHSLNRINEITQGWRDAWCQNHPTPLEQWLTEHPH